MHSQKRGRKTKDRHLLRCRYGNTGISSAYSTTRPEVTSSTGRHARSSLKDVHGMTGSAVSESGTGHDQAGTPLLQLSRTNMLLNAVHRRNRNQHRNQYFYKHLNTVRRAIKELTALYEQSGTLSYPVSIKTNKIQQPMTAASVRRRFDKETQLRIRRDFVEDDIRERIVPAAYSAFSTVVADAQFATLGTVLLGILAEVVSIVGFMKRIEEPVPEVSIDNASRITNQYERGGSLPGLSILVTGPDQGTVVQRVYDSDGGMDSSSGRNTTKTTSRVRDHSLDFGKIVERGRYESKLASPQRTVEVAAHDQSTDRRKQIAASAQPSSNRTNVVTFVPDTGPTVEVDTITDADVLVDVQSPKTQSRLHVDLEMAFETNDEMESTNDFKVGSSMKLSHTNSIPYAPPSSSKAGFKTDLSSQPSTHTDQMLPRPSSRLALSPRSSSSSNTTAQQISGVQNYKDRKVSGYTQCENNPKVSSVQDGRVRKSKSKKTKRNVIDDLFNGFV